MAVRHFSFTVESGDAGLRLDQLLAKRVPELSRRMARKVLLVGGVFIDKTRIKIGSKIIQPGRKVDVHMGSAIEKVAAAEASPPPALDVVFEDDHLLVVDKPAGLPTAAARETDRHNVLYYLSQRSPSAPLHLVHRLDLETSGLLVLAKTGAAAHGLSEMFAAHDMDRAYRLVMLGDLEAELTVDQPVAGRPARTIFVPVERKAGVTLAEARLYTGRTHQIRLHALHIGRPVLGDRRYGRNDQHHPPRLVLHARMLGFRHPITREPMRFEKEWPSDLNDWWGRIDPCRKS